MERNRRPPDVEEALSSMLWTPYQCNLSDSDEDEDSDYNLHASNTNKFRPPKFSNTDLFAITNRHFNMKPAHYRTNFPLNYGYFVPKTYNSMNCELPSYEHVEKERTFGSYFFSGFNRNHSANVTNCSNNNNNNNNNGTDSANTNNNGSNNNNNNGNSSSWSHNGSGSSNNNNNLNCPTNGIYMIHENNNCPSMVHSFTDDFLQYQVSKSSCSHEF